MKKVTYTVRDKEVNASELTLDDCDWLFSKFVRDNGYYPEVRICDISHNLPNGRLLGKILEKNNVLLSDWQFQHGKVKHVRCNSKYYDIYLERYKRNCDIIGRAMLTQELCDNEIGLPHPNFFVKYCPDKSVNSYDDFVQWCGYCKNSFRRDKDDVVAELTNKEKELGRPITTADIRCGVFSFSEIVIKRIWGSLSKCREEIGLAEYKSKPQHSFEEYCLLLDNCLQTIFQNTGRKIISWNDIQGNLAGQFKLEHHTILNAFKREGVDFYKYVSAKGFSFCPYSCGLIHYTDDGELCRSIQELDYTTFLNNELGLKYNFDYRRDVQYKLFAECNSKINCDYVILKNGKKYYVEIAGMLYSDKDLLKEYDAKRKELYRIKTIQKIDILEKSGVDYLFIYQQDMYNGSFRKKTIEFLKG